MNLQKARTGILMVLVGVLGVLGLAGCGGDNPTATPVAPTATTSSGTTTDATATTSSGTMTDATATTSSDAMEDATATTSSGTMEEATPTTGSSNSGDDEATDLLAKAGTAIQGLKSYHWSMKVETSAGNVSTEGDRELPDKWRFTSETAGVSTEFIIIGNSMYSPVPGTDQYIELPTDASLTAAADPGQLISTAQGATVVGDEMIDGADTTHLKYSASVTDASGVSAQSEIDLWIEKSTGYIRQYNTSASTSGVSTTSTVTFSKFNEPVTPPIEKPSNIMTTP
jgi:outer membrane lipoprotein-sorting protein